MIKKYTIFQRVVTGICAVGMIWVSLFLVGAVTVSNDAVATESVNIKDGAKPYKKYTVPKTNVSDALKSVGIYLGKEDTVNKPLDDSIESGMKIRVNRITYKKVVKVCKTKFKTKKKKTSKLYLGQKKIKYKGKNGKKNITYTNKLVNGKIAKTIVSRVRVIKKPKKRVILVGTKRKNYHMIAYNSTKHQTKSVGGIGTIRDHNGKKIAYKQKFTGQATAYSFSAGSMTATGDTVHIGGVAVNPKQIPYGSKLYIESPDGKLVYGYAVANDTGGFAYNGSGTIIDLFYPTIGNCYEFGRRTMTVYVLA